MSQDARLPSCLRRSIRKLYEEKEENLKPMKCDSKISMTFFLALALVVQSCSAGSLQNGAMIGAHKAFAKGDCEKVLNKLSQAQRYQEPSPALKAEISHLRGLCLEKLSRTNEAIGVYKYLINTFPKSEYAYRAKERLRVLEK
jgi:tetratricopeptide (TPR) repeat protein